MIGCVPHERLPLAQAFATDNIRGCQGGHERGFEVIPDGFVVDDEHAIEGL